MAERQIRSGGVDLNADHIDIAGDVVGRDKIVQNINNIVKNITQRPLTAAEEADLAQSIEAQRLKQGVTDYIERLRDRVTASTETGGPYKGLLEYRLSDAAAFFGRQQAIHDLLEHLQRGPLTILHAESGAGKTSLLQAGISPRLIAKGHLPLYLRPYNISPTIAIKRAFIANLTETPNLARAPLRDFLSRVCNVLGAQTTLYLFIDQFEEFYTQLEEIKRAEFINDVATCLEDESLNARWALALRTEFFGSLANFRPRIRNPFENDCRLNRLTRVEAHEAIAQPAAQKSITFEDGLIDTILDELGKKEAMPPQIQLVCSALYETLPADAKVITQQSYDQQHGAKGILQEHLGRVLHRDLPAEQRPIAQHALEALITSDVQRVLRSRAELATDLTLRDAKPETLDHVLNQLVDSRLLRAEEIDGQLSYELAHDYLLSEIQLDPAVQARKAAQELLEQEVHAYQRFGTLLSDDKFAILSPRRSELALNDDAQTLLHKSERALKRRQRLVFGGIGLVIALIAIGLLSIATAIGAGQQQQAAVQIQYIAETKAANAQGLRGTAEAGASLAATRETIANETLRRAFEQTGIVPVGDTPRAVTFDGTHLWIANAGDNTVQSLDPTTGLVGTPIPVGGHPTALIFDGTRLWVANTLSDTVQSIDPTTEQAGPPLRVGPFPDVLAFDGVRLWVAGNTTVQAIDPSTGQVDPPIRFIEKPGDLAFDGQRLWVASENSVQSIDTTTDRVGRAIKFSHNPQSLTFAGQRLWVAFFDTVQSFDPMTSQIYPAIEVVSDPSSMAFDGTRLWIASRSKNAVQALDPLTGVAGPAIVSRDPAALVAARDRLWIANGRDDTLQAIDLTAGRVSVGKRPVAMAFDGTRLWVANQDDDTLQSIYATTGRVETPTWVGLQPKALAFDGARLWIAFFGAVEAFDPTTGKISSNPIVVGDNPQYLTYIDQQLWAANFFSGTVQSIDPVTGKAGTPIKVSGLPKSALVSDGTRLWVVVDNSVQSIDPTTGRVGTPIQVDNTPIALAFDGIRLWVANYDGNTVQSIDPMTGQLGTPLPVGSHPCALTFDGERLWVANEWELSVQPIDPVTRQVGMPIEAGAHPCALFFDNTRLWIANEDDNTVQYIVVRSPN